MNNILANGTVLPNGLVNLQGYESKIAAFNRSYKNTGLKAGLVVASYAANDPRNQSQLCTEYDVQTIEQFENQGSTSILYRNCLSGQGFGAIADFFEFTLRQQTYQTSEAPTFADQDGAIVLIQCLDNIGTKAIVTGTLIHPDRPTTITSTEPQLGGEYNGVNVKVNNDGSCSLTFKGATNNAGVPTDPSQGTTEISIETDGSFQVKHSMVTFRLDKTGGTATLNATKDINLITNTNLNIQATQNVNVQCVDVNVTASGKGNIQTGSDAIVQVGGNCNITAVGRIVQRATQIDLNIPLSGITTYNGHLGCIDLITGVPVIPSETVFSDV